MKRLMTLAVAAIAALALAAPSFAATPNLFGGATQQNGTITLVSDLSDAATTNDFSGINFSNLGGLTFNQLKVLAAEYNVTDDGCGGGSPRFQLSIGGKNVFVYLGPAPNFTGCALNTWTSTGNLIGSTQAIYDLSQLGGPQQATYAQALALLGSQTIDSIQLVVDSGWFFADKEQTVLVRNVLVNTTVAGGTVTNGGLNPARTCRALRTAMNAASPTLFAATFGTNGNARNAFGKCVSMMAHAKKSGSLAAIQLAVLNAVAGCKASGATGAALTQCVLQQIRPALTLTTVSVKSTTAGKSKKPKNGKGKGKGK